MGLRFELGKAYYIGSMNDKAISEFQQSGEGSRRRRAGRISSWARRSEEEDVRHGGQTVRDGRAGRALAGDQARHHVPPGEARRRGGKVPQAVEMGNKIIEIDINYKDIATLVEKWSGAASGSVSTTAAPASPPSKGNPRTLVVDSLGGFRYPLGP
jgi:hypothetical protein